MTKVTTAALLVGPKYIGPFADSDCWRIGLTVQVVDGGSNGPYLHCFMPGKSEVTVPWHGIEKSAGFDALLLAIALHFGDSQAIGLLLDTHNISVENGEYRVAEFYELAPEVRWHLLVSLRDVVKIAWVRLSNQSSFSSELAICMSDEGLFVAMFGIEGA